MSDTKISALTELNATPATDDVLPIVDTSATETKKITRANVLGALLNAVGDVSGNGILTRTGVGTASNRTITGTANEITVADGSGASANPTISLPAALTFTSKTVTGGTFSGITLSGNQNIAAVPGSDHSAVGSTTSIFNLGATIALMDLVYLGSSSKWLLTDADAAATASGMLGICLDGGVDTDTTTVALSGSFVRDDTWNWTPGATLYIDTTTPGQIIASQPSGTDDVIRVVGFAVTADVIYFNPSPDYITHT